MVYIASSIFTAVLRLICIANNFHYKLVASCRGYMSNKLILKLF